MDTRERAHVGAPLPSNMERSHPLKVSAIALRESIDAIALQ
ncbi:MAG: hypothetical protein RID09_24070 [Coleofasciculus sp. G1-WW12-02]